MATLDLTQRQAESLRQMIAEHERKLAIDDSAIEPEALTDREHEILLLLASGHDGTAIATRCIVTLSTVKGHIGSIIAKLSARNARHAVAIAFKLNLISPEEIQPFF